MADLQKSFRMSFLNRFDAISIFKAFTDAEFAQLAKTLIDKKLSLTKTFFTWKGAVDQGTYDYVARVGRSPIFGARPMERLVENVLGTGIADFQINHGVIPEDASMMFNKLAPANDFSIKVNDRAAMSYTVDPSGNSLIGAGYLNSNELLRKLFEANRDYQD
jgi:ATP-dependent Clp protease ATP-binding subunit ClpA